MHPNISNSPLSWLLWATVAAHHGLIQAPSPAQDHPIPCLLCLSRSHQSPQYYQHLSCHALSNPVRPYCVPLWKGLNLDCPTAACSWWSVAGEGQCPGHLWVSANKTRANVRRRTSGLEAPTFQRAFLFRIFFL